MASEKIAVVTGGNKGVGLGVCRGLAKAGCRVILTARDARRGEEARALLGKEGLEADFHPLDVTSEGSARVLADYLERTYGRLGILVNNAAILLDRSLDGLTIGRDVLRETMETNVFGPLRVTQALLPLMKKGPSGKIVNVSSWFGSLAEMHGGGYAGYRISKTCLNALTRILADELKDANILVNAACPGWVRTGMGGGAAPKSPDQGADTPLWLALQPDDGPTGGFFQERRAHEW